MFKEGMIQMLGMGIYESLYMTLISTFMSYVIGLPMGLILVSTDKDGIYPIVWLNKLLGLIVNILRSVPFLILMITVTCNKKNCWHNNRLKSNNSTFGDCSSTFYCTCSRIFIKRSR